MLSYTMAQDKPRDRLPSVYFVAVRNKSPFLIVNFSNRIKNNSMRCTQKGIKLNWHILDCSISIG